jgi:hypothetical protein
MWKSAASTAFRYTVAWCIFGVVGIAFLLIRAHWPKRSEDSAKRPWDRWARFRPRWAQRVRNGRPHAADASPISTESAVS